MADQDSPPPGTTGGGVSKSDDLGGIIRDDRNTGPDGAQYGTSFGDAAPKFWRRGWSVIPLQNGTPVVDDWLSYVDRSPPFAVRAQWLVEYEACQLGVLTGTPLPGEQFLGAVRGHGEAAGLLPFMFPTADVTFVRRNRDGSVASRLIFVSMESATAPYPERDVIGGDLLVEVLGRGAFVAFGSPKTAGEADND